MLMPANIASAVQLAGSANPMPPAQLMDHLGLIDARRFGPAVERRYAVVFTAAKAASKQKAHASHLDDAIQVRRRSYGVAASAR